MYSKRRRRCPPEEYVSPCLFKEISRVSPTDETVFILPL